MPTTTTPVTSPYDDERQELQEQEQEQEHEEKEQEKEQHEAAAAHASTRAPPRPGGSNRPRRTEQGPNGNSMQHHQRCYCYY